VELWEVAGSIMSGDPMPSRKSRTAADKATQEKSSEILRMSPEQAIRNDSDPEVQLFPTIGYQIAKDSLWRIQIQGRISQSAPAGFGKRLMLRGLIRALNVPSEVAKGEIFQNRVRGFLAAPIPGARVQVELAGQNYVLRRKSKASGLFSCKLDLSAKQLQCFRTYGLATMQDNKRNDSEFLQKWDIGLGQTSSPVFLAERTGVSVITDIDDTIKLTEVNSRRRMLQRTFAEPFTSIEGMSSAYQNWAQQGALFHYVSSSPWQIYDSLNQFLIEEEFPLGSMHLKWFRLRDEIFKRWQILRRKSKGGIIRNLIRRLPERTFVLVGDSGERDPEIYAKLASKYPAQVTRICIRQIDANPLDTERLNKIYRRYGMTVPIQVFSTAVQLGDLKAF
jgi:phosphatidate phosphatase APP1